MMISNTAVDNRISVVIFTIIIVVFGAYCYSALPRESAPDITIPYVFVSTPYKGVASADMETSVTIPIEKKLKGLEGVKKIKSVSSEGLSQINIEFVPDFDIDEAVRKVKDKVDEAMGDLPADLDNDPSVFEVNLSEMPIMVLSLSSDCGKACLKRIADDLEDEIEAIPGVLEVEVTGAREREIRIEVDPDKLAYYRIPITAFQQAVHSENQNTSGGDITLGEGRFQLRVPGEFSTPEEIYNLVVATFQDRPIYLKDLAKIIDGFKDETGRSRLNGTDAVNISVKKRSGENILAITEKVDEIVAGLSPGWPAGTHVTKLMDRAKEIRIMLADLQNNIISGLVLVIVVLFFFLGFRNAILVSLSIPFSMLISFIVLHSVGITLNMVVLFSLTLALGMLVDNAIVIIENIYRYMQQGVPRLASAKMATAEVGWPIVGSTITTIAAFFPLTFWPGVMGEFMKYLPITLIITLASCLLVALIINPALAAYFIRANGNGNNGGRQLTAEEIQKAGEQPVAAKSLFLRGYSAFLRAALNHRISVLLAAVGALVMLTEIWLLAVGLEKPVEFFPSIDPQNVYVNIDTPEGADLEYVDRMVRNVELAVLGEKTSNTPSHVSPEIYQKAYEPGIHHKTEGRFEGPGDMDNVEYIYAKAVEQTGGGSLFSDTMPNHLGIQFLDLKDRLHSTAEDLETMRNRVAHMAGALITVDKQEEGPPTGAPINIEISGKDFPTLGEIAREIREAVSTIPHVRDVKDDYVAAIPSVRIRIDRQKAALFGLSTNTIGFALKTAYNGLDISTFREDDEDYDITVILPEKERTTTDVLHKLMLPAPNGKLVPLTTLARIDFSGSMGDIIRINHNRVVTVKASVDETRVPGAVARAQAEELLKGTTLPPGYRYVFTGEFESQKESEEFLSRTFVIALFLIFLILVTLFNSVTQPLIIMTSVVLSLGGVFLGLFVIQSPFGIIMSGVGVISLAGVVVNNAIVLIDYTNKLRDRGMDLMDAVVAAGTTRVRPVLLTAITTILGLIPMVTGVSYDFTLMEISWVSESTQWWRSMAVVVIFGLMVATFLTLVVVPALYVMVEVFQKRMLALGRFARRIYWKPFGGEA